MSDNNLSTATLYTVVNERGTVLSGYARRSRAESIAERLGGTVGERVIRAGDRVRFTWQGWPKVGVVTEAQGSRITVRFTVAAGELVKTISVDKIG